MIAYAILRGWTEQKNVQFPDREIASCEARMSEAGSLFHLFFVACSPFVARFYTSEVGLVCFLLTNHLFGYVCVQFHIRMSMFCPKSFIEVFRLASPKLRRRRVHHSFPCRVRKAQALARIERKPSGAMVRGVYMEGVFESRPRPMLVEAK